MPHEAGEGKGEELGTENGDGYLLYGLGTSEGLEDAGFDLGPAEDAVEVGLAVACTPPTSLLFPQAGAWVDRDGAAKEGGEKEGGTGGGGGVGDAALAVRRLPRPARSVREKPHHRQIGRGNMRVALYDFL